MELLGIFSAIGEALTNQLTGLVTKISSELAAYVNGFLIAATTIWFMVMGFAVMRGELQSPLNKIIWEALKKNLIFAIGLTGIYMNEIVGTINGFASGLMNVFASSVGGKCTATIGGDPIGVYKALDCSANASVQLIKQYFVSGLEMAQNIKIYKAFDGALSMMLYIGSGILLAIGTIILYVILGLEFISIQITLTLMLCIGPIAIACLAFEPTKKYFEGWLSEVIYSIIAQAMIVLFLGLAISIITEFMNNVIGTLPSSNNGKQISNVLQEKPMQVIITAISLVMMFGIVGFVTTKITGLAGGLVAHTAQAAGFGVVGTQLAGKGSQIMGAGAKTGMIKTGQGIKKAGQGIMSTINKIRGAGNSSSK